MVKLFFNVHITSALLHSFLVINYALVGEWLFNFFWDTVILLERIRFKVILFDIVHWPNVPFRFWEQPSMHPLWNGDFFPSMTLQTSQSTKSATNMLMMTDLFIAFLIHPTLWKLRNGWFSKHQLLWVCVFIYTHLQDASFLCDSIMHIIVL